MPDLDNAHKRAAGGDDRVAGTPVYNANRLLHDMLAHNARKTSDTTARPVQRGPQMDCVHRGTCGMVRRHSSAVARRRSSGTADPARTRRQPRAHRDHRRPNCRPPMTISPINPKDLRDLPKDAYERMIKEIKVERQQLARKDGELAREQMWWEEGLRIFASQESDEPTPSTRTLRERIVLVLLDGHRDRAWRPVEIIDALGERGWLPEAASAPQMVRNRIHSMVNRGELLKDALGHYSLAPDIWNTRPLRHEPEAS
jgi:hypothetical protein